MEPQFFLCLYNVRPRSVALTYTAIPFFHPRRFGVLFSVSSLSYISQRAPEASSAWLGDAVSAISRVQRGRRGEARHHLQDRLMTGDVALQYVS